MRGAKRAELTGKVFGRLTVIAFTGFSQPPRARKSTWLCKCSCGKEKIIQTSALLCGRTQSCGCLCREMARAAKMLHGHTERGKFTPEYTAWAAMKSRCERPKYRDFKNYGGRGITVCERWRNDFSQFLADMGSRPSSKHTLDRIDCDGNYEPSNCRWATRLVQCRNKRNNHRVTIDGLTLTIAEWEERTGISQKMIGRRLRDGWSAERALGLLDRAKA